VTGGILAHDRAFLQRVLDDSVEAGLVRKPNVWRGRGVSPIRVGGEGYCFCCIGGGGRGDSDAALVITIMLFAFAFFIGLFYTVSSAYSARQAHSDLLLANNRIEELKSFDRAPQFEQLSTPGPYPSPDAMPRNAAPFYYAAVLLTGLRNERTFAAFAQGCMTAGAGLLTVALLITLIAEPEIATIALGVSGAGLGVIGVCLWVGKHCCAINTLEQEAADRLSWALHGYS
jgi:hypothetical protein